MNFLELGKKTLFNAIEYIRKGNNKVACAFYIGSIIAFRQLRSTKSR